MHRNHFKATIVAAIFSVSGIGLAAPPMTPQVAIVANLYKEFACEAVVEEPEIGEGFLDSSSAALTKYLTPMLANLILKDRKCAYETHEICRLDWLPLWGNQDPGRVTVKVKETGDARKVDVELHYPQEVTLLTYTLQQLSEGWRIEDISYGKGRKTLAEILSAPN